MGQELSDADVSSQLRRIQAELRGIGAAEAVLSLVGVAADRLERPGVDGVVFEVGYADMWGVEVQIEQERLAKILGIDPKVRMPVKVTITPAAT